MDEIQVPVYLIMGFLESGKTSFIKEIFESGEFDDGDKGLLIQCEEGEVELDEKATMASNFDTVTIDEEEELNEAFLQNCSTVYKPKRVFVEYNGMWDPDTIFSVKMPEGWEIYQVVTLIDASTFQMYLGNMKAIIGNMVKCSELLIFNRCDESLDLPNFRRIAKALNNPVQMMFEHKDGRMIELGKDIPPYDLSKEVIEVEDVDYGIWYIDVMEDQDRYDGRKVKFKGRVMKNRKLPGGYFVPGRDVMTCCADDVQFCGYLCKSVNTGVLKHGDWIEVTARIRYEKRREYRGVGPVLYATKIAKSTPPEEDLVYFN